ncbi:MAG: carbohydrate kinase family protein [Myxococcaceae bacterium]
MPSAPHIVCLGEALVDFLPHQQGVPIEQVEQWTRALGGAPANVAVGLSRLGQRVAFVGTTGADPFGDFVRSELQREGVDVSRLRQTGAGLTGLSFVATQSQGEPQFHFYRTRAADLLLDERDVDLQVLERARVLYVGANALQLTTAQEVLMRYLEAAAARDMAIVFDPNFRRAALSEPTTPEQVSRSIVKRSTVVKVSLPELAVLSGESDLQRGLMALHEQGVVLPIVTLGAAGAAFLWDGRVVRVSAPPAQVIDATGAGDGFVAGLIFGLTRLFSDAPAMKFAGVGEIREVVAFACTVGSRVTRYLGATAGLPTLDDVSATLPRILAEQGLR